MQLTYYTLDVFTAERFSGNPLAVVLDADELTTDQMQAMAREFNLSETVFVMKPELAHHSASIRIFTPVRELPFAGHPTLGVAALLASLKAPEINGETDAIVVLEEQIGTVRVGVRLKSDHAAFAEFDAPQLPTIDLNGVADADQLSDALGLIPTEIGFENHKPLRASAGPGFMFVPVASLQAIAKARVVSNAWADVFTPHDIIGAYLYTRQCVHTTSAFHARMFAPDLGIREDAATGSAAVAFAGIIDHFDDLRDGIHKREIEQGYEMNRPSKISLTLEVDGGELATVRIGGQAVRIATGVIEV